MPQRFHDNARVNAFAQQNCRGRVTQIMKTQIWQFGIRQQALEFTSHVAVIQRGADGGREDEPCLNPPRTGQPLICCLPFTMPPECRHSELRKTHAATALFALRLDGPNLLPDTLEGLTNSETTGGEVDISPAEAQQLPKAQAGTDCCTEERLEPLSFHALKKRLRLLDREHVQLRTDNARPMG